MFIIKERQRRLSKIQKMRDATGQYILSKVELPEEDDAIADEVQFKKTEYLKKMKAYSYHKSLVFQGDGSAPGGQSNAFQGVAGTAHD